MLPPAAVYPPPKPLPPPHRAAALMAALRRGPNALGERGAALLTAHLLVEKGEAALAMTPGAAQAYATTFTQRLPMGWASLRVGDMVRFVRFCEIAHIAHASVSEYQHAIFELTRPSTASETA
jgi:hypothetical protein